MKNYTIYYLEDDWRYSQAVIADLEDRAARKKLKWKVEPIRTESAFEDLMKEIADGRALSPDVWIMDVMVRYASPKKGDTLTENSCRPYHEAGLRCARQAMERFPKSPIILYTIIDAEDFPEGLLNNRVIHIPKGPDTKQLFKQLQSLFSQQSSGR